MFVVDSETEEDIYECPAQEMRFGADPTNVVSAVHVVNSCAFEHPGSYYIDFRYNGRSIAQLPLIVKEPL